MSELETESWVDKARQMRSDNIKLREIAAEVGKSVTRVHGVTKDIAVIKGVAVRKGRPNETWRANAIRMFREDGKSVQQIADIFHKRYETVDNALRGHKRGAVVKQRDKDTEAARQMRLMGATYREISRKFNIHHDVARKWCAGLPEVENPQVRERKEWVEKARQLKAGGMAIKAIAKEVKRDYRTVYKATQDVPSSRNFCDLANKRRKRHFDPTPEGRRRLIARLLADDINRPKPPVTLPKLAWMDRVAA